MSTQSHSKLYKEQLKAKDYDIIQLYVHTAINYWLMNR